MDYELFASAEERSPVGEQTPPQEGSDGSAQSPESPGTQWDPTPELISADHSPVDVSTLPTFDTAGGGSFPWPSSPALLLASQLLSRFPFGEYPGDPLPLTAAPTAPTTVPAPDPA
eukprot:RCo053591